MDLRRPVHADGYTRHTGVLELADGLVLNQVAVCEHLDDDTGRREPFSDIRPVVSEERLPAHECNALAPQVSERVGDDQRLRGVQLVGPNPASGRAAMDAPQVAGQGQLPDAVFQTLRGHAFNSLTRCRQ